MGQGSNAPLFLTRFWLLLLPNFVLCTLTNFGSPAFLCTTGGYRRRTQWLRSICVPIVLLHRWCVCTHWIYLWMFPGQGTVCPLNPSDHSSIKDVVVRAASSKKNTIDHNYCTKNNLECAFLSLFSGLNHRSRRCIFHFSTYRYAITITYHCNRWVLRFSMKDDAMNWTETGSKGVPLIKAGKLF